MTHGTLDLAPVAGRSRAWLTTLMWVVCGLLTAAFMLRYARNVRIADMRGAGQYRAVAQPVIPLATSAGWSLLVRADAGDDEAAAICAAVTQLRAGGLPTSIAWVGASDQTRAAARCANVPTVAGGVATTRAAENALGTAGLSMLLLDNQGRYVFGDRSVSEGAKVLELFTPRR
jgi:hypothetical protein